MINEVWWQEMHTTSDWNDTVIILGKYYMWTYSNIWWFPCECSRYRFNRLKKSFASFDCKWVADLFWPVRAIGDCWLPLTGKWWTAIDTFPEIDCSTSFICVWRVYNLTSPLKQLYTHIQLQISLHSDETQVLVNDSEHQQQIQSKSNKRLPLCFQIIDVYSSCLYSQLGPACMAVTYDWIRPA